MTLPFSEAARKAPYARGKWPGRLLALLVLLAILPAASPGKAFAGSDPFAGLSGTLRIAGSDLGLAAVREAADRIMAAHPGITVTVALTGAGTGNRRVRLRQADVCLYDREPGDMEHPGIPLTYVPYGVDPVAIVTNPVNTVGPLSVDQIRGLFGDRITNWSEVGGSRSPAMPIYIEASEEEGHPLVEPGNISVSSQPAMLFTLARNKDTLGYVSIRSLDASLKPIAVNGVMPDMKAFGEGRYRVYRIMYVSYEAGRSPLAKAFTEYMTGPEGQALLESTGYLPLSRKPSFESAIPVGWPTRLAESR